jgi:hypothetical protein
MALGRHISKRPAELLTVTRVGSFDGTDRQGIGGHLAPIDIEIVYPPQNLLLRFSDGAIFFVSSVSRRGRFQF